MSTRTRSVAIALLTLLVGLPLAHSASPETALMPLGAAQVDITPDYPVRLNGYAGRKTEADQAAQRIFAKALAIGGDEAPGPAVFVTVENCAVTAAIIDEVAKRLADRAGLARERLAVCSTHSHTAPWLVDSIPFIAVEPLPEEHQRRMERYTRELTDHLTDAALEALKNRRPARLAWGVGTVSFAVNRRVLQEGRWRGFGVQADGPVDHRLPILTARDTDGKLLAVLANYACHCTTLGGDFNQIAGDWAGYAQEMIEDRHPGAVALVAIGCGADANPRLRGTLEHCREQGRELADEVDRLLQGDLKPVAAPPTCKLETIDLPLEAPPTLDQWRQRAERSDAQGRHARHFLQMAESGQPIPTSVPYRVGVWTFGGDLAMVFLAGEVVVDYSRRMLTEFDAGRLWINAYANDVPCYIASKRVLREGGYEADQSMIYYGLPSRLAEEAEDLIVDTVQRLLPHAFYAAKKQENFPPPKSPQEGLESIRVRPGLKVELVAAEPLIADPVAFDWGPDGRLWVVEMRDYPNGMDGQGQPGGRVKVLTDTDGDGRYDQASLFLDDIPFPTGVMVWREGILVTAAPRIFYAEDTNGDGRADLQKTLFEGFGEGNQQHRVNGLRWGLDHWVYVANGDSGGKIKSLLSGDVVDVSGRDLRIRPDDGRIDAQSGQTQFGRSRDDWGNWFGGNNSHPIWHYTLEDHYLRRNRNFAPPSVKREIPRQPGAAPVFPISRTLERFNDYNMANRFTSACSPILYRDRLLGDAFHGNAFICEPVHNLVSRQVVSPAGSSFVSQRADDEQSSEFFASSDNWCRPSMVRTGPDGAIWIADMYRFVIEHPTWIPQDWMRRLDVRSGDALGRIYRVVPAEGQARPMPRLDPLDTAGLVASLASPNGWVRDMAHQMLLWRSDAAAVEPLLALARSGESPLTRLHALCALDGLGKLSAEVVAHALDDEAPGVRRHAIRLAEPFIDRDESIAQRLAAMTGDSDAFVAVQLAYSLGEWRQARSGEALGQLLLRHADDPHIVAAVMSSIHQRNIGPLVETALSGRQEKPLPTQVARQLVQQARAFNDGDSLNRLAAAYAEQGQGDPLQWSALAKVLADLGGASWKDRVSQEVRERLGAIAHDARRLARQEAAPTAQRVAAVEWLALGLDRRAEDLGLLSELLAPQSPPELQSAAAAAIERIGGDRAAGALLEPWAAYTPRLRSQVFDILLSRPAWTGELLSALESGRIPASQVEARRRQQLVNFKDAAIQQRAAKALAVESASRQEALARYQEALSTAGDPARGRQEFAKKCANCHQLDGEGHPVGPDLAALSDKSPQSMLIAILDPNRAVEDKFLEYQVVLADGRVMSGVIAQETGAAVTLAAPDGKRHEVLRQEIELMQSTGKSLMPEGMEKDISPGQLADILAYLQSSDPPPKAFEGNTPEMVRVSINGRLQLLATKSRIYGPSLVFEPRYANLGYWQSEQDRAVWMVDGPPGVYRVALDYACDDGSAGNELVIEAAGQTLTARVPGSGGWDNYRSLSVGELVIGPGPTRVQMRSAGPIRGALLDLREIRLTPKD